VHDRELEAATNDSVRAGLVASVVSIIWTACASALESGSRGNPFLT
jgi:hypothetical protein